MAIGYRDNRTSFKSLPKQENIGGHKSVISVQ